jgi:hypothetical protein
MTVARGDIKIRYTLKQEKGDALSSEAVHIFPDNVWKITLILVPTFSIFKCFLFFHYFPFVPIRRDFSWALYLGDTPEIT